MAVVMVSDPIVDGIVDKLYGDDEEPSGIFMVTREHEYEGGNGSWYEDYVAEEFGYFTSRATAEVFLNTLRAAEAVSHRARWERDTYEMWKRRAKQNEEIQAQNEALKAAGLPLLHEVWVGPEPEYKPWTPDMSDYQVIEIQEGKIS